MLGLDLRHQGDAIRSDPGMGKVCPVDKRDRS
jgi:hypothetical protein